MRKNIVRIVLCFIVLLLGCYDIRYIAPKKEEVYIFYTPYHKPESRVEKKLDYIIRYKYIDMERKDYKTPWMEMREYIERFPHTQPEMKLQYRHLFTKDFIYAWSKLEKQVAERLPREDYIQGCPFGEKFCILNCAYNKPREEFFYRTIEETEDYAIVQYAMVDESDKETLKNNEPLNAPGYATYRLVKYGDMWLLDGLVCEMSRLNLNFNKPNTPENKAKPKELDKEFDWHLPTSEAEKKLEMLSYLCYADYCVTEDYFDRLYAKIIHYIQGWPHTKPNLPIRYPDLFTKDFIYAWSRLEKETVDSNCGGKYVWIQRYDEKYIEDDKCSMREYPFTVFGDWQGVDFYRTLEKGDDYVVIQVRCSKDYEALKKEDSSSYIYRMVKQNDEWVVDAAIREEDSQVIFNLNY